VNPTTGERSPSALVGPQEIEVIKGLVLEGLDAGHKGPVTDRRILERSAHGCADHCEKVPVEDQGQADGQQQPYSDIYGEPVQCVLKLKLIQRESKLYANSAHG